MDIASRKLHLMEQLMGIVNPDRMERFERFFKKELIDATDVWDDLPEIVQQIVLQSKEESRKGKVTPHNEVMANIKAKYKVA